MKLKLLVVGKPKESFIVEGVKKYLRRVNRHVAVELIYLPEAKGLTDEGSRESSTQRISKALGERDRVILLNEKGQSMDSPAFSRWFYDRLEGASGKLVFVVGGPFGVGEDVKSRADDLLSLSAMTLTHEMALLFLLEQLYRSVMIRLGTDYHH